MKKKFILLPLVCALAYVVLVSYIGGPGSSGLDRTGASGAGTANCSTGGCHSTPTGVSISTTVNLLSSSGVTTTYTPGGTYTVQVTATNTSTASSVTSTLPKFGYQVSVRAGSVNAGTMVAPVGSHLATAAGVIISEHSSTLTPTSGTGAVGTVYTVNIPWTAPAAGTGTVTLYGNINAVNGNTATSGDAWNAASAVVTEATTTGPTPITGTLTLCVGGTTTLSSTPAGGTWTSGTTTVATVTSGGVVNGVAVGTSIITYATGTGSVTATVTVSPAPAAIAGVSAVCPGGTTTLTCTTTGGTWSSSSVTTATVGSSTGVVTGVASGTCTISYNVGGCASTTVLTVNTVPPVTGTNTVCVGATTTLAHSIPGGTWSSSTPTVGTVSSAGVVGGIANGTTTISYTFGTSGCYATQTVTVIGHPAISGPTVACVGIPKTLTAIAAGGTWTSLDVTKATVGSSSGVVTGVAIGAVTIKYKVTTACGTDSATYPMTVVAASACPTRIILPPSGPEGGLHIYPNPNTGNFTLNLVTATNETARVFITDVVGVKVQELIITTNTAKDVILNQPPGLYYVSAITESMKYNVKVFVR